MVVQEPDEEAAMRLLFLAALSLSPAPAGALAAPPRSIAQPTFDRSCPDDPAAHLARTHKDGQYRKLTELPPADAFAAVYRRGPDGCMIPVRLRERQAPPAPRR
jgi:hypothetical protein